MRGQVQLQVPLENLQRTRAIMAAKILELVQQFYTERRVFNISTAGMGQSNLQDPKNERLIVNQQLASGEVINDITLGKYDISMNVIPSRDSWEDQQFAEALNLRNVGVLIPDDRVVEYSHLAHKEELAEEIRKMQGRGELTPQEQQMAAEQQAAQRALMQLEVQKLAMEVRKLEAEAHAKMAELDPNSPEYEMEREELDVKVQLAREELQLRRDLAGLSSNTQLRSDAMKLKTDIGKTTQQSRLSLTQSREKNLADIEREQMKLRSQSKGIDRTIRKD